MVTIGQNNNQGYLLTSKSAKRLVSANSTATKLAGNTPNPYASSATALDTVSKPEQELTPTFGGDGKS